MYIDKRNNNKVIIEKEINSNVVIVKDLRTEKRYIVEKKYLQEIKI